MTTTEVALHAENETRLLSLPIDDSPEQTKRILRTLADLQGTTPPDLTSWHALDRWLARREHRVAIPYARVLADLIPPVAVCLRRDFLVVMNLVSAHAMLHQENRMQDEAGRIVASLEDYAAVRALLEDLFGSQIEATVSDITRDTVEAVRVLTLKVDATASVTQVAKHLKLDPSTASRRVKTALAGNYLVNLEPREGRPAKLVLGEPLPDERSILPTVELVQTTLATPLREPSHEVGPDKADPNGDPCTVAGVARQVEAEVEPDEVRL